MKWIILCVFWLCHSVVALPLQERKIDPAALSQLASALGIPADADPVEEARQRWLRKPGQERWEMAELAPDQRLFVLNWAKEQGIFSAWRPVCEVYDKALILGATTGRMQMRLDYLKQLWNEGIRFSEIVWLTGERPLDKRVDSLTDRCNNESEAARVLWQEADLPERMRDLPVVFVSVPMKREGNLLQRPNTQDTIVAWLKVAPDPCKALFVSNQPFCGYQFAVVDAHLPDAFLFDVVGQGVDPIDHPARAAVTLDSIARWIYTERDSKQTNR